MPCIFLAKERFPYIYTTEKTVHHLAQSKCITHSSVNNHNSLELALICSICNGKKNNVVRSPLREQSWCSHVDNIAVSSRFTRTLVDAKCDEVSKLHGLRHYDGTIFIIFFVISCIMDEKILTF